MKSRTAPTARTARAIDPAGRRERKKLSRKAELLRLARAAFAASGFDATSMEAIAAAADIAVGTVYNYFPTKSDLLFHILLEDLQPILQQEFDPIVSMDGAAIVALVKQCFDWFDRYDRSLIRRFATDALLLQADSEQRYLLFDELLVGRTRAIIARLRDTGAIARGVDPELCASLVFNLGNAEFYAYLIDPAATSATVVARFSAQLDLAWKGIAR